MVEAHHHRPTLKQVNLIVQDGTRTANIFFDILEK